MVIIILNDFKYLLISRLSPQKLKTRKIATVS